MDNGTKVGSLYYDLEIDDKKIDGQLDDTDKKVSKFADNLKAGFAKAAAGFAVVGAGLTVVAKQSLDFAVSTVKNAKTLATQIGTTAEEASRLTAALGRMGISAESASAMFGAFSKNIVAATKDFKDQASGAATAQLAIEKTKRAISATTAEIKANGDKTGDLTFKLRELNLQLTNQQTQLSNSTNAFQKLGLTTVDQQGNQKDFNTILFEVADKFKTLPNGIDKTALALELFGRSGKDMIKVLNLGSEGIKDLEEQADKLGLTLTSQNIAAVSEYVQSQKELKASTDQLKLAIGTTTAPVLTEFNKRLNDILLSLISVDGPLRDFAINLFAFGGPIAGAISGFAGFVSSIVTVGQAIGFVMLGQLGLLLIVLAALGVAIYLAITHIDELGTAFVITTDVIGMKLKEVWEWVKQYWPLLAGMLFGPFGVAAAVIATDLFGIRTMIKDWVSNAASWLYEGGKAIIQGLINGIKAKINDAVNAVKGAGESIIGAARDVLDWHSPSRVFIEAGKAISEGLALGINRNAGMAQMALNNLAGSVIAPAIAVTPSRGGSYGGGAGASYGDTIVSIGQVNDKSDADYILNHMDRNQDLELNGISPAKEN